MKKVILVFSFIIAITLYGYSRQIRISEDLSLTKISDHCWIHTSWIESEQWGRIPANGLVIKDEQHVMIIDTPWTENQSEELISWINRDWGLTVGMVIPTHFHVDNLGGLKEFHRRGIPSWSLDLTETICREKKLPVPQHTFSKRKILTLGSIEAVLFYPGPGHSGDNFSVYFSPDKVLYAGCLIKAQYNQTLGNLSDASPSLWRESIVSLQTQFPSAEIVVPGHGEQGSTALFDHTLNLLSNAGY